MTDQSNLPAQKENVSSGHSISALVPTSIDETFRLAKALAMSGEMVPQHFQGKPEMTMAAIVRGMEVGLAPMQSLSNIAVINGRASLWGDALPAIVQRAGHSIDVVIEGEGERIVATATLVRGDTGKEIVRTFSVDDAKKAGLWGKKGPWQTYPKRMLTHRARAWAVRDGAADALMGLQVAEEMSDIAPMKDVTPASSGFAAKVQQARTAANAQKASTAEPETPNDADVVDGVASDVSGDPDPEPEATTHWTDELDTSDAFPGDEAFTDGAKAFSNCTARSDCPFSDHTIAVHWLGGWDQAKQAAEGGEG